MLYRIKLRIEYDYQNPVAKGRHVVCVAPRDIPALQTVRSSGIAITPEPDEQVYRRDFFGNDLTEIGFARPHDGFAVDLDVTVDRGVPVWDAAPGAALADLPGLLARNRDLGHDGPLHFIPASAHVALHAPMTEFARAAIKPGGSTRDAVIALGQALFRHMTFDANATKVDTPAIEAFTNRRGVCQDFAHIMIGCLRGLGIPAGYVSGYLRTLPPEGMPRLEGADAMHAWVCAWCGPELGWIEYDPTNETLVGGDHITVAYGRDYGDVAPIKGIVRISGGQTSRQLVDVIPL